MNRQDVPTLTLIGSTMKTKLIVKRFISTLFLFVSSLSLAVDTYKVDLSNDPFDQVVSNIQKSIYELSNSLNADNVSLTLIKNNQTLITLRSFDDAPSSSGDMSTYILNTLGSGKYNLVVGLFAGTSPIVNFDLSINKATSTTQDDNNTAGTDSGTSDNSDNQSDGGSSSTDDSNSDQPADQVADSGDNGSSDNSDSNTDTTDSTDNDGSSNPSTTKPTIIASSDMISLSWDIPTSRADGDSLTMSDIQYYEIYHTYNVGTPQEGSQVITVTDPSQNSFEVAASELPKGMHKVAIAVVDVNQLRSRVSDTISITIN